MAFAVNDRNSMLLRTLVVAAGLFFSTPVAAQYAVPASAAPVSPEQMKAMTQARPGGPPNADQPKTEEKKEGEGKKKDEDKDKEKKEEDNSTIKRPDKPPRVPDPREFEVKADKSGRVPPFNFIGQTWPDVLQWLANISNCSLDWQELPNDYLNLTTQKAYSLDEVRDLVNRHLHARGFTMLSGDGVLSVFKIEKLDPSLVPRASEEELYDKKPYDVVKVSFELPEGMDVEKAKEDVKQLLGPHAKVFPLAATKHILLIDAVANLRTVSELLNQERLVADGRIVPREFPLKYARAEQIIDVLYVMVGLDPKSRPSQMELQLQQQKLQLMTQMQQQGKDVSSMLKQDGPPVYLAYNRQRNSVMANAPPEYMKIIERSVRYLDVPPQGAGAAADSIDASAVDTREFKKYGLQTLDPERFVMTLEEIGGLDPWTELRADRKSKSLFVQGTAADQAKIEQLIKQFDGEGREFYVLRLRRIAADLAAVSIKELMFGEEKKEDDSNNRRFFYFGDFNRDDEEEQNPHEGFRVTADVESNRLMLRASEEEMADVRKLLAQMGEIPPERANSEPVRFIQPGSDSAREHLLEQLRTVWPGVGGNELIIRIPEGAAAPAAKKPAAATPAEEAPRETSASSASPRVAARFAQIAAPAPPAAESPAPAVQPPAGKPVTITVTADGRLMLSSTDTAALDRLEQLIEQIAPPEKRFKVFHLNYVTAYSMYLTLFDYFEPELKGEQDLVRDYWGDPVATVDKPSGTGLGRRKKLMITWDTSSNTILVANANARQLWEVDELIKEYDVPAPADSIKSRHTAAIKIRYSKATVIAAALKDVYRDLLSSRDREFQSGDKKEQAANQDRTTIIRYGGFDGDSGGENKRPTPVKLGFEGALSVGVDEIANMIIVSVQEELFEDVVAMVRQLDEEARPRTTVRVHRVRGRVDAKSLKKAIGEALGTPWPGGRPEKAEAQSAAADAKPKSEQDGQPNDRRERRDD